MDTECFCEGESGHDPDCRAGQAQVAGVCPDCEYPLLDHLTADEAEAHGIDPGLRDGLGCAVVARAGSSLQPRETDLQERALVENIFPGTPEWDASEIALADQRRKGG